MTTDLTPATSQTGTTTLGDRGASILRTAVPSLWGTVVAAILGWALPLLPGDVGQALADVLSSDVVLSLLVVASIAAWYAVARWLEPQLPDWLTRIVLGSAAAPTYARVTTDGAAVITSVPHVHAWEFVATTTPGGFRRYRCAGCGAVELEPEGAHLT